MRTALSRSILTLALLTSSTPARAQDGTAPPVPLDTMLSRAAAYVVRFTSDFAKVVAEERYIQQVSGGQTVTRVAGRAVAGPVVAERRELLSDYLLVKVASVDTWVPYRDVFEVDGQPVREREERLAHLLLNPTGQTLDLAQLIVEESARYNLGELQRTINIPLLVQTFLFSDVQPRFRFTLGKEDPSAGTGIWIVNYQERARPTFVRSPDGRSLYANGRVWIQPTTGRVVKTEIVFQDSGLRANITTSFRPDDRFQLDVPFEMIEDYTLRNRTKITGRASYGRFRRFDVQASETMADVPSQWITEPTTGLILVEVPAGEFTMGSPATEGGRKPDEQAHKVTLSNSFYLGRFEVTQQEWRTVMGTTPSRFGDCGPRCPVENVTFDDAQRFLEKLNVRSADVHFRLPTEAEWEYACRAGTISSFSAGAATTSAQANFNGRRTAQVGSFDANPWGLADMHGNVGEWTADWYGPASADALDPKGPQSGDRRVVRGGSFDTPVAGGRCGARQSEPGNRRASSVGFRVAGDLIRY